MKLRSSNLANGSSMAGFTSGDKFPMKWAWSRSRDPFQNFKLPFNIFGLDEAALFIFGKWIEYSKSHPRSKNCYHFNSSRRIGQFSVAAVVEKSFEV